MLFRSLLKYLNPRPSVAGHRRSFHRKTSRLRFESMEDRSLLSGIVSLAPSDLDLLVGERVTWTATADVGATPVYQFCAAPQKLYFSIRRTYSSSESAM